MTRWMTVLAVLGCLTLGSAYAEVTTTDVIDSATTAGAGANPTEAGATQADSSERPAGNPPSPVILVEHPIHDFGAAWVGTYEHAFTIRNAGQAILELTKVQPSCGCTTAGTYESSIPPGGSVDIPFKLATERYDGEFATTITITSNDPAHPSTRLTLRGYAKHRIKVNPRYVGFGNLQMDSVATSSLTIENNTEHTLKPVIRNDANVAGPFKAELVEVEAGRKYELKVTASPPYQPLFNRDMITIDTGIPDLVPLQVSVTARLPDRMELQPNRLSVSPAQAGDPQTVRLVINSDTPVKILEAKPLDERVTVEVKPGETDKYYDLMVTVPKGLNLPPAGTAVVIRTDDEQRPELRLPVTTVAGPTAQPQRSASLMLGQPAPDMKVATQDDEEVKLGGASDKVKVVAFYASWCGYCKQAMPAVEKIYQDYKDKGVEVIAVNTDSRSGRGAHTVDQSIETFKTWGCTFPLTMDAEANGLLRKSFHMVSSTAQYRSTGVPTFFVIDKDGTVEAVHVGLTAAVNGQLTSDIDQLLEGKKLERKSDG